MLYKQAIERTKKFMSDNDVLISLYVTNIKVAPMALNGLVMVPTGLQYVVKRFPLLL
jgi:hypothetical protein